MNILFFTDADITPFMGGVERVTINLVKKLKERGHQCYSAFYSTSDADTCKDFVQKFHLKNQGLSAQLKEILVDQNINVCVINLCTKQNIRCLNQTLYNVSRELGNIKVIYGYYNYPGYELYGLSPSLAFYRFTHGYLNSNTLHGLMTTFAQKFHADGIIRHQIAKKLRLGLFSDEIVLLSEPYIQRYLGFIGSKSTHKFSAIGNPLSYEKNIETSAIHQKEKLIVQVARFDDCFKRQTTALKIWKIIEQQEKYNDWRFIMIGYGADERYIKKTAKQLNLHNVDILPAQDPRDYLRRASIYMLTSAYEGLPMIILDAQQFGVTPIGFDSFEAIHDIIKDNHNGLIIPNNQIEQYASKLMWLMDHTAEREDMAIAGLQTCQKFSAEAITDKWEEILTENTTSN